MSLKNKGVIGEGLLEEVEIDFEVLQDRLFRVVNKLKLNIFSIVENNGLKEDYDEVILQIQKANLSDESVRAVLREHRDDLLGVVVASGLTTLAALRKLKFETIIMVTSILEEYDRDDRENKKKVEPLVA